MKVNQIFQESNIAGKLLASKDSSAAKSRKMIPIMWKHDHTVPTTVLAKLGHKPTPDQILDAWSQLMDQTLSRTNYGDLSADGTFDMWLAKCYADGTANYEDISGEGGDALGAWKAMSIRGLLDPSDQDLNRFKSIHAVQRVMRKEKYQGELRRIRNAAQIDKHKKEKIELVLIDDDRFYVAIPFNYGACYTFNNAGGYTANFCTGSSNGLTWFSRYGVDGIIVDVADKTNLNKKEGKWQFHAETDQLVNADQDERWNVRSNDQKFATLFPGLMRRICDAIESKGDEIRSMSTVMMKALGSSSPGYDIPKEVNLIKQTFPISYASGEEAQLPDQQQQGLDI